MSGAAGAIAAGAGSIGSSLIGGIMQNTANRMSASRQHWRNTQQWENQNAWNLQQWNRENEYNSPQMQMARFKEAGLNPHLIYGKGTPGNATALKSPDVKGYTRAESRNVTQGIDVMGEYNRFKNLEAQTDNVKAQQSVAEQNSILLAEKSVGQALLNKLALARFPHDVSSSESNADNMRG